MMTGFSFFKSTSCLPWNSALRSTDECSSHCASAAASVVSTGEPSSAVRLCLSSVYTRTFTRGHRGSLPIPKQIMELFNTAGKGERKLTSRTIAPVYFLASL